jgi:hypothetical protein
MLPVKDRYDEVFSVEIDGWCYGITKYPGEVFPALVHSVVKELGPSFRTAIEANHVFDILDIATRLSRAAKYLVDEREIAFSMLSQLPSPHLLGEEAQFVLAQVIDQVEQAYGGALDRLERKWNLEKRRASGGSAASDEQSIP